MSNNIFVKSKLDKPSEFEEDTRGPYTKHIPNPEIITKSGCWSCLGCGKPKEIPIIENRNFSKRRTIWQSFTGERDTLVIERRALSSRLVIKAPGYSALLTTQFRYRIPIFLDDVQRFLIRTSLNIDKYDYFTTNWLDIMKREDIKKSVVIIVDGASHYHYKIYKKLFVNLSNGFNTCFDVITNTAYGGNVIDNLAIVPLFAADHENIVKTHGCLESALNALQDTTLMLKAVYPILSEKKPVILTKSTDMLPRTRLVLNASELVEKGFPIPVPGKLQDKYSDYVMTKDKYLPLSVTSPLFSLACERCERNDPKSALYRITLIDEKHDVLYDSYVLPYNKFLRRKSVSDITMQMLLDIKQRIKEAHVQIKNSITPDSILIGETLSEDLHALKLMHPYIISTNAIFNITGSRRWISKLKDVSLHYLDREIEGTPKDNSVECARATMELVQLKLAHNIQFGDKVLTRQQDRHLLIEKGNKPPAQADRRQTVDYENTDMPVILGNEYKLKRYTELISKKHSGKTDNTKQIKLIPCSTNKVLVDSVRKVMNEHSLVMAHLDYSGKDAINGAFVNELDKWIKAIWMSTPTESLISILMTGDGEQNGLFFTNIKE